MLFVDHTDTFSPRNTPLIILAKRLSVNTIARRFLVQKSQKIIDTTAPLCYTVSYDNRTFTREKYRIQGAPSFCMFYRRRIDGQFRRVMLEMIPNRQFSKDNPVVFLFVKNIDEPSSRQ